MTTFICRVDDQKISDHRRAQIAAAIAKLDGNLAQISVDKWHESASDRQRGYWFGVIVPAFIEHCGYEGPDSKEACHHDLLFHLMPDLRQYRKNPFTGEQEQRRVSWKELDKNQATKLIDRAFHFAAVDHGLYIQSPSEYMRGR